MGGARPSDSEGLTGIGQAFFVARSMSRGVVTRVMRPLNQASRRATERPTKKPPEGGFLVAVPWSCDQGTQLPLLAGSFRSGRGGGRSFRGGRRSSRSGVNSRSSSRSGLGSRGRRCGSRRLFLLAAGGQGSNGDDGSQQERLVHECPQNKDRTITGNFGSRCSCGPPPRDRPENTQALETPGLTFPVPSLTL